MHSTAAVTASPRSWRPVGFESGLSRSAQLARTQSTRLGCVLSLDPLPRHGRGFFGAHKQKDSVGGSKASVVKAVMLRGQEDTEEEPDTPRGSRSPTRAAAGTALSRAFSSGLVGRSASLDQPATPTTSARGLNASGEFQGWSSEPGPQLMHPVWSTQLFVFLPR